MVDNFGRWYPDYPGQQPYQDPMYARAMGQQYSTQQTAPAQSQRGGERIQPMSFDEARAWAEEHLDGDEYEAIFGEIADDDTDCLISAVVKTSSRDRLRREAEKSGRSIGEILDALIEGNL